jgi:hypothetical protein
MAKDQPKTGPKPKEPTPFQKFDALARRVVRVPKAAIRDERKARKPNT